MPPRFKISASGDVARLPISPLRVLFPGDLFSDGPTLETQYVSKDVVLAAAGMVIGRGALDGRLSEP